MLVWRLLRPRGKILLAPMLGGAGTQTYANRPERLHITVFHSSRPDDPRPSTLAASMGDDLSSVPIWERRGPTSEEIKAELSAVRVVVLTTERPKEIEVSRPHHGHSSLGPQFFGTM